jgi:uncharacterized damage-inducible protein DinB
MSRLRSELIAALAATPSELRALTRGRELTDPGPDGGWSAAQVVSHLVHAEIVYQNRIGQILTLHTPPIAAYAEGAWAERFGSLDADPELFATLRRRLVRLFESIGADEWERAGLHEERGLESIAGLLEHLVHHDQDHLNQLKNALAGV